MADSIRDLRSVPFAQVESEFLRDPAFSGNLKTLYSLLITYGPTSIFPGQETLAKCMGVTRETVNRWLRELRQAGLIAWENREGTSNRYFILGYANYLKQQGVIEGSHPTVKKAEGVIEGSHPLCAQDHTPCDPTITRSRSHDPDPINKMGSFSGIWASVLQELEMSMTRTTFDRWLKPARLLYLDRNRAVAIVEVASGYAKEWVEHRLHVVVCRTLAGVAGIPLDRLTITYQVAGSDDAERTPAHPEASHVQPARPPPPAIAEPDPPVSVSRSPPNVSQPEPVPLYKETCPAKICF